MRKAAERIQGVRLYGERSPVHLSYLLDAECLLEYSMLRIALCWCLFVAVALLLSTPTEVAAKSTGIGTGARHPGVHRGAYRAAPWVGGYAFAPYYSPDYVGDGRSVVIVLPPPEPPYRLTCGRSRETMIVPSEDGGSREIGITRC